MSKKLFASLLLAIYLFSIGGQLALYQYFSFKSDRFFIEQTRKGMYNKDDLTEVQLPLNMPGISNWNNYLNITGCIRFDDVSYNYVKMKVTRTALYLMCVPNYSTTRLVTDNIIDARGVKGMPVPPKQHVPFGNTVSTTNISVNIPRFSFKTFESALRATSQLPVKRALSPYSDVPWQPPKLTC